MQDEPRRKRAILRELDAARDAIDQRKMLEVIARLRLAERLCEDEELGAELPPPPAPVTSPVLLDIKAVSKLTTYSVGRLRHMGNTLPGYYKSPTGKVGWWQHLLIAGLLMLESSA
jgi:hypothetical protein